jgi:short-subunit dehydrogenase
MSESERERSVALVTGASSGIGYATATRLAAHGYRVFGTSRSGARVSDVFEMLPLDVDHEDSVRTCVETLVREAGRIDVLVNNAGRAMVGACEETTADEARALFETNVFGLMRVTSRVLPAMRARRRGSIVNMGSLSGFIGVPFHGVYAATKHAVAGYTESLRLEVAPFGVRVALIEPAAHRTHIAMSRPRDLLALYDSGRTRVESIIRAQIENGASPERVVDVVVRAAMSRSPRARYRVGFKAHLGAWARRFLPARVFERFLRHEFRLPQAA